MDGDFCATVDLILMASSTNSATAYRLPAEWEPHDAVWIAWPHEESDFPTKLDAVSWVYVEIVRLLATSERVEILVASEEQLSAATERLASGNVSLDSVVFHLVPTDRSWLRDSAPTSVLDQQGEASWVAWRFNAWAKYDNYSLDSRVPAFIAHRSSLPILNAEIPDREGEALVLEGGAFESDGLGTLLVTEECLLSSIQARNPGLGKQDYERAFERYLGIHHTIWLAGGCVGDDTHGHIDDIARFAPENTVLLTVEENPKDENFKVTQENLRILSQSRTASGEKLNIKTLPFPQARFFENMRLPASYANFYVSNHSVLIPTFNDPMDQVAINTIQSAFPDRRVSGIYCGDLILGQGALHCLTQPQFAQQKHTASIR